MIYNSFCNFEIAPALEILATGGKTVTVFAKSLAPVRSEEGLMVMPECAIDALEPDEYDSLLLLGAMDIREAIENEAILAFIRNFQGVTIGAISVAPLLLLRAGLLSGKRFMAGINPEELAEEGFSGDDLALMHGWDANLAQPVPEGYIRSDNIITSVSYGFVRWALAFGAMVGIELSPRLFGLE